VAVLPPIVRGGSGIRIGVDSCSRKGNMRPRCAWSTFGVGSATMLAAG
jgi:hypothetical protein